MFVLECRSLMVNYMHVRFDQESITHKTMKGWIGLQDWQYCLVMNIFVLTLLMARCSVHHNCSRLLLPVRCTMLHQIKLHEDQMGPAGFPLPSHWQATHGDGREQRTAHFTIPHLGDWSYTG
jgi:hypothetical protein